MAYGEKDNKCECRLVQMSYDEPVNLYAAAGALGYEKLCKTALGQIRYWIMKDGLPGVEKVGIILAAMPEIEDAMVKAAMAAAWGWVNSLKIKTEDELEMLVKEVAEYVESCPE